MLVLLRGAILGAQACGPGLSVDWCGTCPVNAGSELAMEFVAGCGAGSRETFLPVSRSWGNGAIAVTDWEGVGAGLEDLHYCMAIAFTLLVSWPGPPELVEHAGGTNCAIGGELH
ncbi:hypothetical protein NDU88_001979 [Pleurodeles waltl]|uniref:Uncharacterized protein n=1 Tax=Pleurodeles waltl TaxID=8319 RepID=A0AAV7T109_PLEWA|nr:hypothetical protein NDU88_001979 [Pleurodeles waltl]